MNVIRCKGCGEYMELPPVECDCEMTAETRQNRHIAIALTIVAISFLLTLFGGCWINHYYATEQIKALPKDYEVRPDSTPLFPDYQVKKKGESSGIQVDPRIPVRPQAPETPKK